MNKLSKRAISIIVIATFLISMIPIMPAGAVLTTVNLSVSSGDKGDTVTVSGGVGEVTSGATLEIYWDTALGSGAYLLNSTTGKADGSWEVNFDVPEATTGEHYVWAKDVSGPDYASTVFTVVPLIKLSPSSGLVDDEVTVKGYGFAADDDIAVYFSTTATTTREVALLTKNDATAEWSTTQSRTGTHSAHLKTTGTVGAGDEARIIVPLASGTTLGSISSISWWEYLVAGYAPHVDVIVDLGSSTDALVFEYAYNGHIGEGQPTYGALTGAWYQTFSDDGNGPAVITDTSYAWLSSGPAGGPSIIGGTLSQWKTGGISGGLGIDLNTPVLRLEIEVDNWMAQTEAYLDDIAINGASLGLEEDIVLTTTDDVGSFDVKFDIPTGSAYGSYYVGAADTSGAYDNNLFAVGASIILTPDEGPTGSVVTVEGRGWTATQTMSFAISATAVLVVDGDTITVEPDGTFTADVVIPNMGSVDEYSVTATETLGAKGPSSEDFDITGIPKIVVSPTYGSPGAVITVTGSNFTQIAGTEVYVTMDSTPVSALVTAETKADGTFVDTFVSPAVTFTSYTVTATDEYSIAETDSFKVGLIALIINPISGESGTKISITGIGFDPGSYNLTFGDELYADYGTVSSGEAISDNFYIPNVDPGVYTLVIIDTVGNELTVHFTVTESTTASVDPAVAPNDYNVTLSGNNFADVVGTVTCEIYNSTGDWPMTVQTTTGGTPAATATNIDGNFTGWWKVDAVLSIGDYTINVTDSEGLLVQLPFSVVAARVEVTPRKALFDRGNAISFDISNDFELPASYIKIYSPDETLYWITDDFTGVWVLVDNLYTVPYYRQTANQNPMDLASDAPLGTWTYFFYDTADDELMNGTFAVGTSTAAQVDALLEDVRSDLAGLADDVAGITDDTDDLADDIDALSSEIGDMASEMDNLKDDIVDDLANDIAAATDAGLAASAAVADLEGALGDLEDSMGDIADASNSALDAAQDAADAAADAAIAAEGAGDAAKGLTSLVYGAIGASLIAALAAIVSLMQISKKIAG